MRDDLYDLTAAQRARARAGWGQVPARQRLQAAQSAKQDLPAPDPLVSAAARRYGEYLLARRLSNRLPRSLLPLCGALVVVAGVLLWTAVLMPWGEDEIALGMATTAGGVLAMLLGLLDWSQRRAARLLVSANPVVQEVTEPH